MSMNSDVLYAPLPFKAKRDSSWAAKDITGTGRYIPPLRQAFSRRFRDRG